MPNLSAVQHNQKCEVSFDNNTQCNRKCSYCYIETGRNTGFNAKKIIPQLTYKVGTVKRMGLKKKNVLKKTGFRAFSFSDWQDTPQNRTDLFTWMDECKQEGIKVKFITKNVKLIPLVHDHKATGIIHLSVDAIKNGVPHKLAKRLRQQYKKVIIRSVILKDEDLQTLDFADLHTMNHGNNGFKNYAAKKTETQKLISKHGNENKTCCVTGKCNSCPINCLIDTV